MLVVANFWFFSVNMGPHLLNGHFLLSQDANYLNVKYIYVFVVYIYIYTHDDSSPSSHFICCFSLSLTQRTRAQLLRVLGRQRSLDKFLLWEGILGARWLPHLGEARVMKDGSCDDERGASFREAGAGSSLIPSTSIQIPFV